jgi:hypothetical protein
MSVCLRHRIASHHLDSSTRSGTYHRASLHCNCTAPRSPHSTPPHLTAETRHEEPGKASRKDRILYNGTGIYGFNLSLPPNSLQLSLPFSSSSRLGTLQHPLSLVSPGRKPTRTPTRTDCLPPTIVMARLIMTRPIMRGWLGCITPLAQRTPPSNPPFLSLRPQINH